MSTMSKNYSDVLGEKFKKVPKQSEIMKELFEELERE